MSDEVEVVDWNDVVKWWNDASDADLNLMILMGAVKRDWVINQYLAEKGEVK